MNVTTPELIADEKKSLSERLIKDLGYPKFEDIPVSTKTIIVLTNITIDLQKLFETLPITEYILVPRKRGRKKKGITPDPNKDIPCGSIINVQLAGKVRGTLIKKKKEGKSDHFRNSVAIVMKAHDKMINFKISRNGKFQMTGCKTDSHAETCVKHLWEYVKDFPEVFKLTERNFKATFIPAMRNIDFSLGFHVDRESLDRYMNSQTDYFSLLETSIGYTGTNIKIPVEKKITDLQLKQLVYSKKKDSWKEPKMVPYEYYLDRLKEKDRTKKLEKTCYNTFLVFHSGKVIMSSMCEQFAKETFYQFLDIVTKNKEEFREKLDE